MPGPLSLSTALLPLVIPLVVSPVSSLASPDVANAHGGGLKPQHHRKLLRRGSAGERNASEKQLVKRGQSFSGRATFYSTGLGACGGYNSDSDYIVALNQAQYESGSWCGKQITISYGGNSATATIVDECPGCPYGGLDMSPGLFQHFASQDAGVFYMTWTVGGGDDSQPSTTTQQWSSTSQWHPTTTWSPSPTTTWKPSTTWSSSTWSSSSWSSSASSSASSSKASSSASSASASSGSASSAATVSSAARSVATGAIGVEPDSTGKEPAAAYAQGGNLDTLNQAIIALGALALGGAKFAVQSSS